MKLPDNMKIGNFDIGLKALRAKEISVALNKSPEFRFRETGFVEKFYSGINHEIKHLNHLAQSEHSKIQKEVTLVPMLVVFMKNILIATVTIASFYFKVIV